MKKYAVLSMDIEDWFHLDYFEKDKCDQTQSTLDGLDVYLEILDRYNIKTTFFVVGEIVNQLSGTLRKIIDNGHEVALHSFSHRRPLTMSMEEYKEDTLKNIKVIRDALDYEVKGYRAPCFSMDRERLNILEECNLRYDASLIRFSSHNLYGKLDLKGFSNIKRDIFIKDDFFEFETSTVLIKNKNIPISGGGYLRIFPWFLTRFLLTKFFKEKKNYFFYIHPFEFSKNYRITIPVGTPLATRVRFNMGRKSVDQKMHRLITMLQKNNYEFVRFQDLLNKN